VAEPTDLQLANFAALRCFGAGATELQREVAFDLIAGSPAMRELWLEHHAAFQADLRRLEAAVPDRA
jgi:hypothetical protein